jgi:hypothetical protein
LVKFLSHFKKLSISQLVRLRISGDIKKQEMALSSQQLSYIQERPVHTSLSVKCQLWPRFRVGIVP